MNKAIRITALTLGFSAAIAGLEHGYFELLQGSTRPDGTFIASIGPPCQPEMTWNACEPALTIVPDFQLTGILAILFSFLMLLWSVAFVHRKHGGLVLILLSLGLLLFGGGLFPPLIGIVAGLCATRINKPLSWWQSQAHRPIFNGLARLYPWALIAYLVIVLGQFIVGYYFNAFLLKYMSIYVLFILGSLLLSVLSAFAHDAQERRTHAAATAVS